MAYGSWIDLEGSYLAESVRTGDASPLMEIHRRLIRVGEAYKYAPCPRENVSTYFAEPLVRWGLEREDWLSLFFNMNDTFPRTSMIEYVQRAMCAVLTMARETATYYITTSPYSETRKIARNEDWSDYTGAGSDVTEYPYVFEYSEAPYTGYDWIRSDRPDGMGECTRWIEQIRDVLDELRFFAIPFTEIRLIEAPANSYSVIDIGGEDYKVPYVLGVGENAKSVRSSEEETVTLRTVSTQDPDGWDEWSPLHDGHGTSWLLDDLTWGQNGNLPVGTSDLESGGWNWAAAGTHQAWVVEQEPVESDQVMIIDVEYTPNDPVNGEMLATWQSQNRGDKFYHYGSESTVEASYGSNFYDVIVVDQHIGDVVDASDLTQDTYIKTWAEQDLGWTWSKVSGMAPYGYEPFVVWWAKNWMFLDIPDSGFSVSWTSGFAVSVGTYRKLELDFSAFWTGLFGETKPWTAGVYRVTYTLRTFDNIIWTWVESHVRLMVQYGTVPFTLATYGTSDASILRDRRAPGSDLIPITVEVDPPYVDVYRYDGHHLNDGLRIAELVHTAWPLESFDVVSAVIIGAGAMGACRNQRIAVLNGEIADLDSGDMTSIRAKNPGQIGFNIALLGEDIFTDLESIDPADMMVGGDSQLNHWSIYSFPMGATTVAMGKIERPIDDAYFGESVDAFCIALILEVLSAYDPIHHYYEAESGGTEPYRVSVLPQLAYRPYGDAPLYQVITYLEVTQNA